MEHTNKIAIKILKDQYSDYPENAWHYDEQYKMIVKGIEITLGELIEQPKTDEELDKITEGIYGENSSQANYQGFLYGLKYYRDNLAVSPKSESVTGDKEELLERAISKVAYEFGTVDKFTLFNGLRLEMYTFEKVFYRIFEEYQRLLGEVNK